jgi:hypothetical protein
LVVSLLLSLQDVIALVPAARCWAQAPVLDFHPQPKLSRSGWSNVLATNVGGWPFFAGVLA